MIIVLYTSKPQEQFHDCNINVGLNQPLCKWTVLVFSKTKSQPQMYFHDSCFNLSAILAIVFNASQQLHNETEPPPNSVGGSIVSKHAIMKISIRYV